MGGTERRGTPEIPANVISGGVGLDPSEHSSGAAESIEPSDVPANYADQAVGVVATKYVAVTLHILEGREVQAA